MTNHPNRNRSKHQQATHTPGSVDRLNEWWQRGNKSDPTYAAGNAQFATDVGFLLKNHAELLAALNGLLNCFNSSGEIEETTQDQLSVALENAEKAQAKAEGR